MRKVRVFLHPFVIACLAVACCRSAAPSTLSGAELAQRGQVDFRITDAEPRIAERFRLAPHTFVYEEIAFPKVSERISISEITFPSAVHTESEANNTVHCEYYRPQREGKLPAVIVLHILGGDFPLARVFANSIAQRGAAALFLKMPYYGPRRDPQLNRRMISKDPAETIEGMTQAILDIRRATALLASREEIDPAQLGIFGISLGGITGALAAGNEPRLQNVCLLLAGGDIGRVVWESREIRDARTQWEKLGKSPQEFFDLMRVVDPVTYARNARDRRILMLNAREDEVIPKACTVSLWEELGKPDIVWYEGGHYSVIVHLLDAIHRVGEFYSPP